jgi:hypothetical protein
MTTPSRTTNTTEVRRARLMVNVVETRFDAPVTLGGAPAARERALLLRGQVNF